MHCVKLFDRIRTYSDVSCNGTSHTRVDGVQAERNRLPPTFFAHSPPRTTDSDSDARGARFRPVSPVQVAPVKRAGLHGVCTAIPSAMSRQWPLWRDCSMTSCDRLLERTLTFQRWLACPLYGHSSTRPDAQVAPHSTSRHLLVRRFTTRYAPSPVGWNRHI